MTVATRKSLEPWLYDTIEYYPYQIKGIRQLARRQNFLLADDMGLGKSLQALTVATIDVVRGWAEKILIVCPLSLKGNWADEIEKFTRFPYVVLGHEVVPGTEKIKMLGPADRSRQLEEFAQMTGPRILIVNYEQVIGHVDELNKLRFDICMYDEAHYIKNYKSKRTKAALKLSSTRHFLLTGTPLLNRVNELWPLLHKIDPVAFPRYWAFVQRYCMFGGYKGKEIVGVKNERELTERLQAIMLRRMKKDVLDLPEVQIIKRMVELHPEQRAIYDELKEELKLEMMGEKSEVDNPLTKFLRLKQICGTTTPFNGKDISSKLDLAVEDAIEILMEGENRKLVVFSQFLPVMDAFAERMDKAFPAADIWELRGAVKPHLRQGVVKEWASHPGPAVLVCNTTIAGVGLNMTAAQHAFFLDKLFVPGLNQQAIDRLHRIGADSTQPVQIYEYLCRRTIESRVEQILTVKKKLFGSIVDESDYKRKLVQAIMEKEFE